MKNYPFYFVFKLNLILFFLAFTGCGTPKIAVLDPNEPIFVYMYYDLDAEDTLIPKTIYEVYPNKELKITSEYRTGYETFKVTMPDNLFDKVMNLKTIQNFRETQKLEDGFFYAGSYSYIALNNKNIKEAYCYIGPFMSEEYELFMRAFYDLSPEPLLKNGTQTIPEAEKYQNIIVPLHKKAKLPEIVLPPPSAN